MILQACGIAFYSGGARQIVNGVRQKVEGSEEGSDKKWRSKTKSGGAYLACTIFFMITIRKEYIF